jgi:cobalt-zinc-cadmium efflux system protein
MLRAQSGVQDVHHLHLWSLASDVPALSSHVVLASNLSTREAQEAGEQLKSVLLERFGIEHVTLELEPPAVSSPGGTDTGSEDTPR